MSQKHIAESAHEHKDVLRPSSHIAPVVDMGASALVDGHQMRYLSDQLREWGRIVVAEEACDRED